MRILFPLSTLALLLASCGQDERESRSEPQMTQSVEESAATADMAVARGIGPTAAPGVAFNYRYGFRLPGQRVREVQQQHAAACEQLGTDRCRITGMLYRLAGERDIEAMLAFKLDPAIARKFAEQGVDAVVRADGMLTESEITGEDAGADIAAATRSESQLAEELRRVEGQLARRGLSAGERAELQVQAQQLRESIRGVRATRMERREALARTPVVFRYGSGDLAPGFDSDAPIAGALEDAWDNLVGGIAALILIVATLLPWLALLGLGWLGVRRIRQRLDTRESAPTVSAGAA